jgi:hypothetical protein
MQPLSDAQAGQWCADLGLTSGDRATSRHLRYPTHGQRTLRVSITGTAVDVVGLAYMLAVTRFPDHDESAFAGALLWLRRWEIWSESIDRVGYAMFAGIRARAGQADALDARPAQLCAEGDFLEAHALLCLPMLFEWDMYFIPRGGSFVLKISHERYVDIVARDDGVCASMLARFGRYLPTEVTSRS